MEQWAEIRRLRFVRRLSIREISRQTGLHRETIRRAIASEVPPNYSRAPKGSKLDPFKDEIGRLLAKDPTLPGVRIGELLEPLGWVGGKTILDEIARARSASSMSGSPSVLEALERARQLHADLAELVKRLERRLDARAARPR